MGPILTNQAFFQSRTWREGTESVCRPGESPDALPVWRQVARLLRRRGGASAVVTMGPRVSLAYGLACAALGVASRQVLCEVFLDAPRRRSPAWRLKTAAFRWVARRALGAIVNCEGERASVAERFGMPLDKVVFVPLCTTVGDPRAVAATRPARVVTAGRTARDLETFWGAARKLPEVAFEAIVGADQALPEGAAPGNLSVVRECPWADYMERLGTAAVVALPLLASERSTGQVVILEAMALGKAVVTTRQAGTADYVRDGETGLLVGVGDAEGLAAAIHRLLADAALADRLGAAALAAVRREFDPERHAERRLAAVRQLAE